MAPFKENPKGRSFNLRCREDEFQVWAALARATGKRSVAQLISDTIEERYSLAFQLLGNQSEDKVKEVAG